MFIGRVNLRSIDTAKRNTSHLKKTIQKKGTKKVFVDRVNIYKTRSTKQK